MRHSREILLQGNTREVEKNTGILAALIILKIGVQISCSHIFSF